MNGATTIRHTSTRRVALRLLCAALFVAVLLPDTARGQTTQRFIEIGHELKFFKGTEDPPDGWNEVDFVEDERWFDGKTPIGYGESPPAITLQTTLTDMVNSYLTVYLRLKFNVPNPSLVERVQFVARYDDGFVAYINGRELWRSSMPAGTPNRNTAANDHEFTAGQFNRPLVPPAGLLVAGENVLAIEVHNTSISSSDLIMEPQLLARVQEAPKPEFIRGAECDGVAALDIGDPIYLLRWQFGGFYSEPGCVKSCDMNDDGRINLSDAVYGLSYLFLAGPAFPEPYPDRGIDPSEDILTCVSGEPQ